MSCVEHSSLSDIQIRRGMDNSIMHNRCAIMAGQEYEGTNNYQ